MADQALIDFVIGLVREAGSDKQPPSATMAVAVVGLAGVFLTALVALVGHQFGRKSAERAGEIARKNAVLSARLAVNSKLADLRQSWINNLRNDMAEYQGLAVTPDGRFINDPRFFTIMTRIELFVNANDADYAELKEALYSYIDGKRAGDNAQYDTRYVSVCQRLLKREWEVLKNELDSLDLDKGLGAVQKLKAPPA